MKLLFFLCLLLPFGIQAQTITPDEVLISETFGHLEVSPNAPTGKIFNDKKVLQTKSSNFLATYNPAALGLKTAMLFYQHVASPQLSASCLYQRSCSNFSKHAIATYGIVKGVFLSADRLTRCNEYSAQEHPHEQVDPVTGALMDEPSRYRNE